MRVDSSRLVRLLAGLTATDVPEVRRSFADRLGQWLAVTDALPLSAVLDARAEPARVQPARAEPLPAARPVEAPPGRTPAGASSSSAAASSFAAAPERMAVADEARAALAAVRAALDRSLAADGTPQRGRSAIRLPVPEPMASADSAADFTPYRRYYLARQREMKASIDPLRAQLRSALAGRSASLRRLAALDAVLGQALAERERSLLATIPGLLARRFGQLYKAHQASLAEAGAADDPARWMAPGGWLAAFCAEMHTVLQAELELRLQPLAGLVAAIDREATGWQ